MNERFPALRAFGNLALCLALIFVLAPSLTAQAQVSSNQSRAEQSPPAAGDPGTAFFGEPEIVTKVIHRFEKFKFGEAPTATSRDGFYPELTNLPTGSGWFILGPGYRHHLAGGKALLDGSGAISWRGYKVVQGRFELPQLAHDRLTVGTQAMWRDEMQVRFFGTGPDSLDANDSQYRIRATDVVGYATAKASRWLSFGGRVGWLQRPEILASGGTFKKAIPDLQEVFPNDPVLLVDQQPSYLHSDLSVTADNRDHAAYPTRGGIYRASWEDYSDRDGGTFSFQRYQVEGLQLIPVVAGRWTLAAHGFGVFSDVPAGNDVPIYLMPSLGGHNSIRAYHDYRFHDRNVLLLSVESRFGLTPHMDVAVFYDAGNVAPRAADLNLDKTGYGVGWRVHGVGSTMLRIEYAHGAEGNRIFIQLHDPFRISRLTKRMAPMPFVQ
jgi:hypothetical protein